MAEMNLVQQAGSILATIRESLKNTSILATTEVIEQRAAVCMGCEKLREKKGKYACVVCGCGFKKKISVSGSSCPIGKW